LFGVLEGVGVGVGLGGAVGAGGAVGVGGGVAVPCGIGVDVGGGVNAGGGVDVDGAVGVGGGVGAEGGVGICANETPTPPLKRRSIAIITLDIAFLIFRLIIIYISLTSLLSFLLSLLILGDYRSVDNHPEIKSLLNDSRTNP